MARVTVNESVPPVHVDQKPRFETIQDSRGRTIQLRKLGPLEQGRIVMAVGGETAGNQTFMSGFALPAAMVVYIDDVGYGLPNTLVQIEAMLKELGEEGMEAINNHFLAKFEAAKAEKAAKAAKDGLTAEQAAAKN
ncbi:hypothetical protein OKW98_18425 [Pseudomonas sp. KU26590]|uniref:hypothetical protein n=1 Tax=Pseudomonas sp. KU26590 TaxID=2991051 RepID=UPI00223CD42C|nr:hypothetical protein [Pseudomonas sp. KU26590]UZJ58554.1 hypothetical protein OKW98_18425 [Pseudomonas sp. KU26590]